MLRFTKIVKCLPVLEYFTVFMKNRNFISKIRRSKVKDYAALMKCMIYSSKYVAILKPGRVGVEERSLDLIISSPEPLAHGELL